MLPKCFILLLAGCITFGGARSQTIVQLTEQLSMDIEKLSELKAILQDMYTDYEIINKGYTDIKQIAEGNFNLHQLFLDGLWVVSPAVRNYPRVVTIINTEYNIVSEYKAAYNRFAADGHFTPNELNYLAATYAALFQRSLRVLGELTMVMTDNQLRMSDDQRLSAIDRVYEDITGQLGFLRRFNDQTSLQAIQRLKAANDLETLKKLYGITP